MKPTNLLAKLQRLLASNTFFWLVVALFVLQAGWIAVSAVYPQAFDEQYHFGLIQIYAQHYHPFLGQQPANAGQYSAITRDPSYLFHYLLSFPYRLLAHLTGNQVTQVIVLRFVNIALLASSLIIFRKVLRLVPISRAAVHAILACLVLLPTFPLLGSQINYDNLLIPLIGLIVYWTIVFIQRLRSDRMWEWDKLLRLFMACLLTSLVKYPFLPIFAGLSLYLFFSWLPIRKQLQYSWGGLKRSRLRSLVYGLVLLVSLGLFIQRDGYNIVRYMTPIPECNQVLSIDECQNFGPWARNYRIAQQHIHLAPHQVWTFPFTWIKHIVWELMFALSSNFNPDGTVGYHAGQQFIVVQFILWGLFIAGLLLVLWHIRRLWSQPVLRLFIVVSGIYVLTLFLQNLRDYLHLGVALAIHGRYLFPVLPLMAAVVMQAFLLTFNKLPLHRSVQLAAKTMLASVILVLLLLQGGGFATYILRSNPTWFWPQSPFIQNMNAKAKSWLKPIVYDVQPKS